MGKQYNTYILLSVAALLSWLLVELKADKETTQLAVPLHSEDFFSTGYTKIEMNDQGRPDNQLVAARMAHFSDDGSTELIKPVMTFYKPEAPPWVVHSETGFITADHDIIDLNGKVFIERKAAVGYQLIQVNTRDLQVLPQENIAKTDAWAELTTPSERVSGIGMKVFFNDSIKVKLFSHVRSRYETL